MKSHFLSLLQLSILKQEENMKSQEARINKNLTILMDIMYHFNNNDISWFPFVCKTISYVCCLILKWRVFIVWKNEASYFKTVKIGLLQYFKMYSSFRHYIPQNLLLTVKNTVSHYFWMAAKEEKLFWKISCLKNKTTFQSLVLS